MNKSIVIIASLALSASAWSGAAQQTSQPPQHSDRPLAHQPFVAAALDTNKDGIIDSAELANAPAALKALDKNGNGQLEMDEVQPQMPHGRSQPLSPPAHARQPAQPALNGGTDAPVVRPPHAAAEGAPALPGPAILAALDPNRDGIIDAAEMANAPAALKALDKNGDGQLTLDEYNPPRQAGPRRLLRHESSGASQHPQSAPAHRSAAPVNE